MPRKVNRSSNFRCSPAVLRRLALDEQGQALVIFTLSFAVLLGFAGLVLDGGRVYYEKRRMQVAADAAARGGAFEIRRGNDGWVEAAGLADSRLNGFDNNDPDITVTINRPPASGAFAGNNTYVEAVITQRYPTTLMRVANRLQSTVRARSVAGVVPDTAPPCVLALNPTASNALVAAGSAVLNTPTCKVMANSNNVDAIQANGGGCINARKIGYVRPGNYAMNGGNCLTPPPDGQMIPDEDPYAYLVEPNPADYPIRSNSTLNITSGNFASYVPLQPGYYRGGIRITGGSVTALPGLYIVDGLNVAGTNTFSGTGVTFYNTGAGLKNITIAGTANCDLHAPTSGPWENILFFNSRSISNNPANQAMIIGTSTSLFEGVSYFPSVDLVYGGNQQANSPWAAVVADRIAFMGTPYLNIGFGPGSGRNPTTTTVTTVE